MKIGPTLAYAVRDLAAHMSRPGEVHWEAIGRCVGYLKGLKVKGVTLYKPEELRHVSACDADFSKCTETRKSVGGETIRLEDVYIMTQLRARQLSVCLRASQSTSPAAIVLRR